MTVNTLSSHTQIQQPSVSTWSIWHLAHITQEKISTILHSKEATLRDYFQYVHDNINYLQTIGIEVDTRNKTVIFWKGFKSPLHFHIFWWNGGSKIKKLAEFILPNVYGKQITSKWDAKFILSQFFEQFWFAIIDNHPRSIPKNFFADSPQKLTRYNDYVKKFPRDFANMGIEINYDEKKVNLSKIRIPIASYMLFWASAVVTLKELAVDLKLKEIHQVWLKAEAIFVLKAFFEKIGFEVVE